jgi:hypothetical protein
MAITTRPHIISRTTYDIARDIRTGAMVHWRARQVVYVKGLATGPGAKAVEQAREAALACDTASELDNPALTGLVVDHVHVELTEGGHSAFVYVDWINPTTGFSGGVVDQDLESLFDGGVIAVPWVQLGRDAGSETAVFGSGGRPAGTAWHGMKNPAIKTNEDDAPTVYFRQVPVFNIRVPFQRTSSAITASVGARQGRVNSDTVSYGGFVFPVRTLRFNKVSQRKYSGGGTNTFIGFYDFTARPDAWDEQSTEYVSSTWTVKTSAQHESATFAGAFPAA